MIGVRIPKLCTGISSQELRGFFRQINVGSVSTIDFDNLCLGTATRSSNVYFRQIYDIPRAQDFVKHVSCPNTNVIYLYKKQILEFKPILDEINIKKNGEENVLDRFKSGWWYT